MKSVRIRSFSGPYFHGFGLNLKRYGVSLRNQSECEKIWTRNNQNTEIFYAVFPVSIHLCPRCPLRKRHIIFDKPIKVSIKNFIVVLSTLDIVSVW